MFSLKSRIFYGVLLFLCTAVPAFSQIAIKIESSHPSYILYDGVYVRMLLHNYSPVAIAFGENEKLRGELKFIIKKPDGTLAQATGKKPMIQGTILEPGKTVTLSFNLAKHFSFQQQGRYVIQASINHPQFTEAYQSNSVAISVKKGKPYWQRKIGIPSVLGKKSTDKIPTRKYTVQSFYDGKISSFYLLVEDAAKVYAIRRLGFDMGTDLPPQLMIDHLSRLHVMIAADQNVFVYYIYNYDGKMEFMQVYKKTSTSPFLVQNPADGSVVVDGGRIAHKDVDYEEISNLAIIEDPKKQKENDVFSQELPEDFGEK